MDKIKRIVKNTLIKHRVKSLDIKDDFLTITLENISSIGKKYLVIQDKETGRRVQFEAKNNEEIKIPLKELSEINRDGFFNFYMKTFLLGRMVRSRTPFNPAIKLINFLDRENKNMLMVTKTKSHLLSIRSKAVTFNINITDIKLSDNGYLIEGDIEDFENQNPISGNLIVVRRDTKTIYQFPIELQKQTESNLYHFVSEININEFYEEHLVLNSRWDVSIQLEDEERNILFRELTNLQSYKEFQREEERYLVEFHHQNEEENLTSLYATVGRNSLALWHTDKNQFSKTYNIARGRTVFKETMLSQSLDHKMVFFESFLGKNYSGNPKYVYEEMLRDPRFKDFTFVWSYTGEHPEVLKGNPIIVDRESEEYYKYLALSKYWVSNILFPVHTKREGNVYLQTWHGTPLKRLGWDIEIEGPETLARENFYIESRNWDYLIAANQYSSEIFRRAFKYEKEMLEVGYPANDIFYRPDVQTLAEQIKEKLSIPANKKVILYAPTWRDNEMVGSWEHSFKLKFDLEKFYQNFGNDYVLILRMHHLISDNLHIDEKYKSFVVDCSHYDDIQELYIISDILITDYSSVFFDYANSRRPMIFYAYDYEDYKENIRGFYLDMEKDLPGPVIQDEDSLIEAIKNIDSLSEQYKERYDEFYEKFCSLEDGKAAKRVIDQVFKN